MRLVLAMTLALMFGLTELIVWQIDRAQLATTLEHLTFRASEARATLESELNASLFLGVGISSYLQSQDGEFNVHKMENWLQALIDNGHHVRNIGIAPGNRLSFIYPLQGNEAALGLHYQDVKEQWPAIEKMMRDKTATLSGPLQLKQGGQGLVYRAPIFIDGQYWGLISTVLNADSLLSVMKEYDTPDHARLGLAAEAPGLSGMFTAFWGYQPSGQDIHYSVNLHLPNTVWQLTTSQPRDHLTPWLVRAGCWVAVIFVFVLLMRWREQVRQKQIADRIIRAQQEFNSAILERTVDGILTLNETGHLVSMNAAARKILGYEDSPHAGQTLQERLEIDAFATLPPEQWLKALTATNDNAGKRILARASGLELEVITAPLLDVPQARWLIVLHDVSERLQNERLKNEFVATVSHELRTPLTSISGALALLVNDVLGVLPDRARQMIKLADANARRLTLLINDLLDMEKLLAGHLRLALIPAEVEALLTQSLEEIQGYADKFHVGLRFDNQLPKAGVHTKILVDADRMQQILANLLSNAIKFSPPDDEVMLRAESHDNAVRISVMDHGPGIPEDFQPRLFQKFAQADSSDMRRQSGTGLGLAITRELVERMGGQISYATSRQGTRFFIDFPQYQPDHQSLYSRASSRVIALWSKEKTP